MKLSVHMYERPESGTWISIDNAGILSGHLTGDIMDFEGSVNMLKKIRKNRKGDVLKAGGNAALMHGNNDYAAVVPAWEFFHGWPIIFMKLEEYERLVGLFKKHLEHHVEIFDEIEVHDQSILDDEAEKKFKEKFGSEAKKHTFEKWIKLQKEKYSEEYASLINIGSIYRYLYPEKGWPFDTDF